MLVAIGNSSCYALCFLLILKTFGDGSAIFSIYLIISFITVSGKSKNQSVSVKNPSDGDKENSAIKKTRNMCGKNNVEDNSSRIQKPNLAQNSPNHTCSSSISSSPSKKKYNFIEGSKEKPSTDKNRGNL